MRDTAIFDMDGLLLDTEPLWTKSMKTVSERHEIPVKPYQFKETTGLKIYEVVAYWAVKYPWQGASVQQVSDEVIEDIIALSKSEGRVMPGVLPLLRQFRERGVRMGVATSSPRRMLHELISYFELEHYFDVLCSADEVGFGKPHPAVYLHCAERLRSNPLQCIVFEDSFNGMVSGKAARMKVIAVPDPAHFDDPRFAIADERLHSLEEFHYDYMLS
ncbi:hexitol phosphatase HxpB [Rurimicrobium arvi]|uniref:Hexitol phosphatase HxpB n=2 Tax=Rurimicrobium arvi TaxID=2049916 RepID=A0ABP8MEV0_9BACT